MSLARYYSPVDISIVLQEIEGTSHPADPQRVAHTLRLHTHGSATRLLQRSTGQLPRDEGRARQFVTSFGGPMAAAKAIAEIFNGGKGQGTLTSLEADPDPAAFKVLSVRVDALRPQDVVGAGRSDPDPGKPRGTLNPLGVANTVTVVFGKYERRPRELWPWIETCYPELG